jgi:hypothetical protein
VASGLSREESMLSLQRAAGNAAVASMLAPPTQSVARDEGAAAPAPAAQNPHYRFEIKAWIPFAHVPDPESPAHEVAFRAKQPLTVMVDDYKSQYRGDGHKGYAGSFRVFQVAEFDWDGSAMQNVKFPDETHYGTTHRDATAHVHDLGSKEGPRAVQEEESKTVDKAVSGKKVGSRQVDLGMASGNPLTIGPAPDIDAGYSLFMSQDSSTLGLETATVRWSTDLMPNHGFRLLRNGTAVKEKVVNSLPDSIGVTDIFVRLNSKTNGGSETFEPTAGS